jgi:POT family proton-dependent oligopeptide transporter
MRGSRLSNTNDSITVGVEAVDAAMETLVKAGAASVRDKRTLFGHPVGLFVLFFTEMWERFSFYGMRVLLVLYMTKHLIDQTQAGGYVFGFGALRSFIEGMHGPLNTQPLASAIYGLYTGCVYLTPLFGGMLADRILGQRKTVLVGGVLMAIGHFLMAIESMFLLALLFLIIGNGCFKPNISTQVGSLYPEGDPRRDSAFTIFYMGINLGAFFAPLVCGTLGQVYGWHYGFSAAGVGMIIGLMVYLFGQRFLATDQHTIDQEAHAKVEKMTTKEWRAVIGLLALGILNIVFWGVYEQQGNTLQIFADKNVNWEILGWSMPTTWYQSLNPMFIFVFAPLLIGLWRQQSNAKKEPSSVGKMAIGCTLLALSFMVLIPATQGMTEDTKISFLWLVASTLVLTIGELYISPIGLSLVTKVAPKRLVGLLMGVWFLSVFFGNTMGGYIGMFYERMSRESFFILLAGLSVAVSLAIFTLKKPLKNAIGHDI